MGMFLGQHGQYNLPELFVLWKLLNGVEGWRFLVAHRERERERDRRNEVAKQTKMRVAASVRDRYAYFCHSAIRRSRELYLPHSCVCVCGTEEKKKQGLTTRCSNPAELHQASHLA